MSDEAESEILEFFQRSVALHRSTVSGIPGTFSVQESVQQFDSFPVRDNIQAVSSQIPQQQVLAPPKPTITAINPNNGRLAGGSGVLIDGTKFVEGAEVKFNNVLATEIEVIDETLINCKTPPWDGAVAPGFHDVDVKVSNVPNDTSGDFSAVKTNGWHYYAAPTVTSVNPTTGPGTGGTVVKIFGQYFLFSSGYVARFDGIAVLGTIVNNGIDPRHIQASTPPHAESPTAVPVEVVATDADRQIGILGSAYTYGSPPGVGDFAWSNYYPNGQIIRNESIVLHNNESITLQARSVRVVSFIGGVFTYELVPYNGPMEFAHYGLDPSMFAVEINGQNVLNGNVQANAINGIVQYSVFGTLQPGRNADYVSYEPRNVGQSANLNSSIELYIHI